MKRDLELNAGFEEIISAVERSPEPRISFLLRSEHRGSGKIKRLGVFPSSFNPMTIAHREIVFRAMEGFKLQEVLLLLDRRNVDKEVFGASMEDRMRMLLEFCRSNSRISAGIASHGLFVDKVPAIMDAYPWRPDIFFIVGQDTIERVMDKKYYRDREKALSELFQKARFIVVPREEGGEDKVNSIFTMPENLPYAGRIEFLSLPPSFYAISSTLVRELVKRGEPFNHLVPEYIWRYIMKKGLYRN